MIRLRSLTLAIAALAFCGVGDASAQTKDILGRFKDWDAYKLTNQGQVVCYAITTPKEMAPKNVKRDPVYFIVSHFPGQNQWNQPSIQTGYPYRSGSQAIVTLGGSSYAFFTKDDGAWLADNADEKKLIEAMRKGASMVVKGTSSRGTITTDRYSLSGISAALDKIDSACK